MGVQDRDWYREALRERERAADGGEPARLPRKPAPTWLIVMAWVVALLIVLAVVVRFVR